MNWAAASALLVLAVYLRLYPSEWSADGPEAFRIEPNYRSQIEFENGAAGSGEVLLTARGDAESYDVIWNADGARLWGGIGLQQDGFLGFATHWYPVEYPRSYDVIGIAIYRIYGGRLQGTAFEAGQSVHRRFAESLEGPASLNGRFETVSGGDPSRSGYVKITAKKGAYLFARIGDHPVMTGVGVRIGDALIVSYSNRLSPAVTALCPTETGLSGLRVDSTLDFNSVVLTLTRKDAQPPAGPDSPCQELVNAARP